MAASSAEIFIGISKSFLSVSGVSTKPGEMLCTSMPFGCRSTSSDLTDLVYGYGGGVWAHGWAPGRKKQYGPYLYDNKDYAEDKWNIDYFDWKNYHERIGVKIEKSDYKWI